MEKRVEELLEENKRYHARYVEMRDFAYSQIEMLLKQLNAKRRQTIQNTNLNVYKQLFDKERKNWQDEREKQANALGQLQSFV